MSNGNGHRWSKFWWQDHQGDAALRSCSLAARGYWVEALCVMHVAAPIGHLLINGRTPTARQMGAIAGCSEKEALRCEAELETAGVFSRTTEGVIYCRRMVRDAAASDAGREHISKRWNGAKTPDPPNRVPIREPTRKPNGEATSHPTRDPIAQKLEVQTEQEKEERKEVINKLTFSSTMRARPEPPGDALDALMADAGIEKPERIDRSNDEPASSDPVILATIRRTTKACTMRVPYGEVRSVEAQLAALEPQPAAVGAEMTMGLRWQPAEPVRSPAEQLVALLSISLVEAEARLGSMAA